MSVVAAGTVTIGDLTVPRLGYGTMRLTGPGIFGQPADRKQALEVLRRAVELGVRVIDTAWYYGPDVANEILAEALRPYKDDLVLITKLGAGRRPSGAWVPALTPEELRAGCERDLRLLGVDSIPVVHLRWMPQGRASFHEALDEFARLQEEGKIQRIGLSNITAEQLDDALEVVEVVTVSNAFSVVDRADAAMVDRCARDGIAYLPFFPLGASNTSAEASTARNVAVATVAERVGATPVQVALAWLLQRSPAILPIPGTSQVAHLEENIAAVDVQLSPADLLALDAS